MPAASPLTPGQTAERRGRGEAIATRKRAFREWEEANPGVTYDPDPSGQHSRSCVR